MEGGPLAQSSLQLFFFSHLPHSSLCISPLIMCNGIIYTGLNIRAASKKFEAGCFFCAFSSESTLIKNKNHCLLWGKWSRYVSHIQFISHAVNTSLSISFYSPYFSFVSYPLVFIHKSHVTTLIMYLPPAFKHKKAFSAGMRRINE